MWKASMDKKILDSKKELRKRLASLSPTEKIRILEKLRDRELALAGAGLRKKKRGEQIGPAIKKEEEEQK